MIKILSLLVMACLWCVTTMAQCPEGSVNSNTNLVVNGDFELGNVGFNSGYTYTDLPGDLWWEGKYAVGAVANDYNDGFNTQAEDHTTGSGQYLIVNGAPVPGVSVWCQTIPVQPNTLYLFSTWVTSVSASNPAALQFSINGAPLGNVFSAPSFLFFVWPGWVEFNTSWYSDTNTVATICVLNQETTTGGNDFGLDDISFQPCNCTYSTDTIASSSVCSGIPTTLTAAAGATSYEWSPSTGLSCATCQTVTTNPISNTTYTLIATLNFCSDTTTAEVTIEPTPIANAGNDTAVCANHPVQLNADGGVSFSWTPSTGLSLNDIPNPIAAVTETTTFVVTVSNGSCSDLDTVVVNILNPDVTAGNDTSVCFGNSVNLFASGASEYIWLPLGSVGCSTCATTNALPLASTTYTLVATTNGCIDSIPVSVTVWELPLADAGSDTTVCLNSTIVLEGSGGTDYLWSPATGLNDATIQNPSATALQNITYTLTVTDVNGCSTQDSISIFVNPLPTAVTGGDVNVCIGHQAVASASGGISYAWSPSTGLNNTTGSFVETIINQDITYTVTVTDANGCTDDASVTFFALNPQPVFTTPDTVICYGHTFQLVASGGVHYDWNGPNGSCDDCDTITIVKATTTGEYVVEAIDSNGCGSSAGVNVLVDNTCEQLLFPTAFSPNGDKLNDLFRPYVASITSIRYFVYNRWGQLIFSGSDSTPGWDGTFKGTEQPVGSYSWYANAVSISGKTMDLQGNVTLIR